MSPKWEDVKLPVMNFSGESDSGRGNRPSKKLEFLGSDRKLLPARPILKKLIALAFFKAIYQQIPYWVHFTFKVENPIYMFTSIE